LPRRADGSVLPRWGARQRRGGSTMKLAAIDKLKPGWINKAG
jgi:hypothetical protein